MPLRVIGAGFGRTGTLSMKAALEQLGFAPCYHMAELLEPRPGHSDGHRRAWVDFMRGRAPMDWEWLLQRYDAVVDLPMCLFHREIMQAFPDAKVILTVRDSERWFASYANLFRSLDRIRIAALISPKLRAALAIGERVNARLGSIRIDHDVWIRAFERHNREVVESVPAERLLVYEVGQGWEPLCRFLGLPVPEVGFPHLNEAEALNARVFRALVLNEKGVFSTDGWRRSSGG